MVCTRWHHALKCAVGKPIAHHYAVCILTIVEPITTHYLFQMSLINNGAFHFKVVRRQSLSNSSLSDKHLWYLMKKLIQTGMMSLSCLMLGVFYLMNLKDNNQCLKRCQTFKFCDICNEIDDVAPVHTNQSIRGHKVCLICMQNLFMPLTQWIMMFNVKYVPLHDSHASQPQQLFTYRLYNLY